MEPTEERGWLTWEGDEGEASKKKKSTGLDLKYCTLKFGGEKFLYYGPDYARCASRCVVLRLLCSVGSAQSSDARARAKVARSHPWRLATGLLPTSYVPHMCSLGRGPRERAQQVDYNKTFNLCGGDIGELPKLPVPRWP